MEGLGFMVLEPVLRDSVISTDAPPMHEYIRHPEMLARLASSKKGHLLARAASIPYHSDPAQSLEYSKRIEVLSQ